MTDRLPPRTAFRETMRLLARVKHQRHLILGIFGTMLLAAVAETLPIGLAKAFFDNVLMVDGAPKDRLAGWLLRVLGDGAMDFLGVVDPDPRSGPLLIIIVGILITGVLTAIATFGNTYLGRKLANLVVADLRRSMMQKVLSLPMSWFTKRQVGDLVSRFSADAQTTFMAVNVFLLILILQPLICITAMGWALAINWRLAIAAFAFFPVLAVVMGKLGRRIKKHSTGGLSALGQGVEAVNQVLSGLRVIKAFKAEEQELARYESINQIWVRRLTKLMRTKAVSRSVMDLMYAFTVALVLAIGGAMLVKNAWGLDAKSFSSFVLALATVYRPIQRMANAYNEWQESMAAAHRIFEVLDTPSEPADRPQAQRIGPIREGLRFEDVRFAYVGENGEVVEVLHGISFEIPAGRTVALVGASGAGKSTIADLLLRFHRPQGGRILFDGIDAEDIEKASLLEQVAVVSQHPFLFNATVRENIAFGRPQATMEEIVRAARAAHIHDVILALPQGYETVVGERGESLSGGQRQRVTIARAILKGASFLILDEATSSLDSESEAAVQEALENLLEHRTALVIAHRLATVARADHVLVIERGRIIEQGTHDELREADGAYARLVRSQSLG